jgi:hypothetical protein
VGDREPLWSIDASEEISRARVAQSDERFAVALRRGGRTGKLVVGWFDQKPEQHSVLHDLPLSGAEVGLPSLALDGRRAAIAAAVRGQSSEPWRIGLATSEWHGPTVRIPAIELTTRPDADTFAPSIISLGDSRWLLQWTEGQQGQRSVRALTLDAAFKPVGNPIQVSDPATNAGGGQIIPVDQGLLSLFLVQQTKTYDLWVTPLACHLRATKGPPLARVGQKA